MDRDLAYLATIRPGGAWRLLFQICYAAYDTMSLAELPCIMVILHVPASASAKQTLATTLLKFKLVYNADIPC